MADEYLSDEEQAERIKQWFRENGVSLVVTVVVAVAALLGWRQWQDHSATVAANASTTYQEMVTSLQQAQARPDSEQQYQAAREKAEALLVEHPKSSYADFAGLTLARLEVEAGNFDAADDYLRKVVATASTASARHTARLRLARVQLEQGRFDEVETTLKQGFPEAWRGQALEIRGDMLLARNDAAAAREVYQSALDVMEAGDTGRRRVEMKLNDLASAS